MNCADEKAAKKHFHVLAMSLEALSAIQQRCRDMEALFSSFHIGDVGRGVIGGYRGCRLGHLVASSSVYCARVHENVKNPVNFHSTGLVVVAKA
jgi:hypothetical protein